MNGAESLVRSLLANGVDVCFTNPGTSEMHFVAALDHVPGMRCVLGLFEGVVTGAADGYYRMSGKPASTLLHLGPGLGNGIANLHNAKKAFSGVVNIVGDHATYHLQYNAPLTSDIEGLARPVSHWVKTSPDAKQIGHDGALAVQAARQAPGQIATLILPADTAWNEATEVAGPLEPEGRAKVDADVVENAAKAIREAKNPLLLVGGDALRAHNLEMAGRIAAKTGAKIMSEGFNSRLDRGAGRVQINRIPYVVELAKETLAPFDKVIMIGAKPPVAFFAYPDKSSTLYPDSCEMVPLSSVEEDIAQSLEDLADALDARGSDPAFVAQPSRAELPTGGAIAPDGIAQVISALLPENAIVVDESVTTGRQFFPTTAGAPPHVWMNNRGGSIGYGLPVAIGSAIACPDQKVIALEGDGSAMYTIQSLWTMARENLDITIMVFANRSYNILRGELTNVGVQNPGPRAVDMLTLDRPDIGWVDMARSMGVDAQKVSDLGALGKAFDAGLSHKGPYLIELEM